jgi:hypothetical protein
MTRARVYVCVCVCVLVCWCRFRMEGNNLDKKGAWKAVLLCVLGRRAVVLTVRWTGLGPHRHVRQVGYVSHPPTVRCVSPTHPGRRGADPFLLIFQDDGRGNRYQVYKSEVIKVSLAPKWKARAPSHHTCPQPSALG